MSPIWLGACATWLFSLARAFVTADQLRLGKTHALRFVSDLSMRPHSARPAHGIPSARKATHLRRSLSEKYEYFFVRVRR
jgi:hypothetical protein